MIYKFTCLYFGLYVFVAALFGGTAGAIIGATLMKNWTFTSEMNNDPRHKDTT